jgi:hypothetical protein
MRSRWRTAQVANELQKAAAAKDAEIQALKASWMRARWRASWRWPRR